MQKIKIILASRPKLLSEVIRNLIEHQSDMEVLGEVLDPLQLMQTFKNSLAEVVIITPLKSNGIPKICQLLLVEYPHLKILTQSVKGESVYLYQSGMAKLRIEDPSEQSILNTIRKCINNDFQG